MKAYRQLIEEVVAMLTLPAVVIAVIGEKIWCDTKAALKGACHA